jgi:hypothetical protein
MCMALLLPVPCSARVSATAVSFLVDNPLSPSLSLSLSLGPTVFFPCSLVPQWYWLLLVTSAYLPWYSLTLLCEWFLQFLARTLMDHQILSPCYLPGLSPSLSRCSLTQVLETTVTASRRHAVPLSLQMNCLLLCSCPLTDSGDFSGSFFPQLSLFPEIYGQNPIFLAMQSKNLESIPCLNLKKRKCKLLLAAKWQTSSFVFLYKNIDCNRKIKLVHFLPLPILPSLRKLCAYERFLQGNLGLPLLYLV